MTEHREHVEAAPRERDGELHHVIKTDPDPRVRRRAQALLWVAEGHSQASVGRVLQTSAYRVHVWQQRFDADGRAGLVDRPRGGRPHALSEADRALLAEALDRGPHAYGVPVTIWSIRDLHALLQREHDVTVSVYTVHRAVQALGYRYRRPRHDRTHRQDAEAVAAAKPVLDWLPKNRVLSPDDAIWSPWTRGMRVKSIRTPTGQRSGDGRGAR